MMTTYLNTEKYLHSSEKFRIQLGLERISAILDICGNPQDKLKVIHIAGTNGKGSVCTLTAEILRQSGYNVGLYTSPHIFKYNERFKINGKDISDEKLGTYVAYVEKIAKSHNIDLTEFEILTVIAFKYFCDEKVDFVVLETGLGGRFDATNVVKTPLLTAITSVSIDHKDRLGDTIDKIAFEKAGIIKENVDCVINSDNKGFETILQVANEKKSRVIYAEKKIDILFENGINYAVFDGEKREFALWGIHQKQNLSLVLKIVEELIKKSINISQKSIDKALEEVFIPARFQFKREKNLIIDGSHNADAALLLRKNLDFYFPNRHRIWIYGCLSTKEYDKVVNILFQKGDDVLLHHFDNVLSVPEEKIYSKIKPCLNIRFNKLKKTANILKKSNSENLIIITGSFYMISDLVKAL